MKQLLMVTMLAPILLVSGCETAKAPLYWTGVIDRPSENGKQVEESGGVKSQESICRYNKDVLGLPIKLKTYRAITALGAENNPVLKEPISHDKRAILKTNLKHECLCGSKKRRAELKCSALSAGAEEKK